MTSPSTFARRSSASRMPFSSFSEPSAVPPILPAISLFPSSLKPAAEIIFNNSMYAFILLLIFSTDLLIVFIALADVPMLSASCTTVHVHTQSALTGVNTANSSSAMNTTIEAAAMTNALLEAALCGISALRVSSIARRIASVSTFLP